MLLLSRSLGCRQPLVCCALRLQRLYGHDYPETWRSRRLCLSCLAFSGCGVSASWTFLKCSSPAWRFKSNLHVPFVSALASSGICSPPSSSMLSQPREIRRSSAGCTRKTGAEVCLVPCDYYDLYFLLLLLLLLILLSFIITIIFVIINYDCYYHYDYDQ